MTKKNFFLYNENKVRKKKSISIYILDIIIIFILSPKLFNYGTVIFSLEIIYLMVVLGNKIYIEKKDKVILTYLLFFLTMQCIYILFGISKVNLAVESHYFRWSFITILPLIINKRYDENEVTNLVSFILLVMEINILYAIFSIYVLGKLSYTISASYSTAVLILSGICLIWMLNSSKLKSKIFVALVLFSQIYFNLFIAQRATNIVLMIIMFGLILVYNFPSKKSTKFFITILVICFYYLYTSENLVDLIRWFSNLIGSDGLSYRFESMIDYFQSGGDVNSIRAGSLKIRINLSKMSFNTFLSSLSNFLFGIGDHRIMFGISDIKNGIGNHSEIIDSLARFGIFGTALFIKVLIEQYKLVVDVSSVKKDSKLFAQITVVFIIYILRNFTGSAIFDYVAIQLLVMLPFVVKHKRVT